MPQGGINQNLYYRWSKDFPGGGQDATARARRPAIKSRDCARAQRAERLPPVDAETASVPADHGLRLTMMFASSGAGSRDVGGRLRIDSEIPAPIRRKNHENPLWGAPRIHEAYALRSRAVRLLTAKTVALRHPVRRLRHFPEHSAIWGAFAGSIGQFAARIGYVDNQKC